MNNNRIYAGIYLRMFPGDMNNKEFFGIVFILVSLSLTNCKKIDTDPKPSIEEKEVVTERTPLDSAKIVEALTATGRYWVLESIVLKTLNQEIEISEDTNYFNRTEIWQLHAMAYSFVAGYGKYASSTYTEAYSQYNPSLYFPARDYTNGLYGKRPYGAGELIIFTAFPGPRYYFTWKWDESVNNIRLYQNKGFIGPGFSEVAYLDRNLLPVHKNLTEAKESGKSERIRFVVEKYDEKLGNVNCYYTLRAAWIIKSKGDTGYGRYTPMYDVLY